MGETYVVVEGDCLASIAAANGFSDWRTIYNASENADFRQLRPNPNVIFPGDEIVIPTKQPGGQSCGTSQVHRFVVKLPKARLRVKVADDRALKYELAVGEATFRGKAGQGAVIEQPVAPDATTGTLKVYPESFASADDAGDQAVTIQLQLGGLDPADTWSGAQARLSALGYYYGDVNGTTDDATVGALAWFQQDSSIDITGELDDNTQQALIGAFGC
jgi:N-acetylmuramoyl-L-alanine amidase